MNDRDLLDLPHVKSIILNPSNFEKEEDKSSLIDEKSKKSQHKPQQIKGSVLLM